MKPRHKAPLAGSQRGTGRTHRLMFEACAMASRGVDVAVICHRGEMLQHCAELVEKITAARVTVGTVIRRIRFSSDRSVGSIRFLTPDKLDERLRGWGGIALVDHEAHRILKRADWERIEVLRLRNSP